MLEPEPSALPLGDIPSLVTNCTIYATLAQGVKFTRDNRLYLFNRLTRVCLSGIIISNMQPNQQYNPFENPDPNPSGTPPPNNDPWSAPSQSTEQNGYQQPQPVAPPVQQPYDPWTIQAPQPGHFQQPGTSPTEPPQQWNPKTSMFEPVQPVRPSEWEQQFVAETVAAAAAPPAPKKSHAGRIIALIFGILILLGGAAAAYVYAQQKQSQPQQTAALLIDTEDLFYQAIQNHMSVSYVGQQYELDQTNSATGHLIGHVKGVTDFSDPAKPKSKIVYDVKNQGPDPVIDVTGEILDLQESNYYARLTKTDTSTKNETAAAAGVDMETWYQIPTGDLAYGMFVFDIGGMRPMINSSEGQVVVGNYSKQVRQDLMKFIKDNNVYTIKDTKTVDTDKEKTTKYTVVIDSQALNKLNEKARTALGLTTTEKKDFTEYGGDNVKYEFFVDTNKKRFSKVYLERLSEDKKSTDKMTITLSYPNDVTENLKKPATIKSLPASSGVN